jgi:hypothetical protein
VQVGEAEEAVNSLELEIRRRFPAIRQILIEIQGHEQHAASGSKETPS